MTPRRIALVVLATATLLLLAVMLLAYGEYWRPGGHAVIGPAGCAAMGVFAAIGAAACAKSADRAQRRAWTVLTVGLGGWTAGSAVWCYVALGGGVAISASTVAILGYLVLPICAVAAVVVVPARDDTRFGIGLLLDGVLVAGSLLVVFGSLATGPTDTVRFSRIALAVATTLYFGLVVMTAIVMRTAMPGRKSPTALLTGGFAIIATAGAVRVLSNWQDRIPRDGIILAWIFGIYLIVLSTVAFRPGPHLDTGITRPSSRLSIWLPYLPLSLAVIVGASHFWPEDRTETFVYSAGLAVIVTMLGRHLLALDRKEQLLAALSDAVLRDSLTGLANRRLFDDQVAHAVRRHRRLGVQFSVVSARVDDFRVVNDTLGYAASDELLRSVAARMKTVVRSGDTLARMGGDEFAILVEDRAEMAAQVAERLIHAFDSALDIANHQVFVHLSIGVASVESEHANSLTAGDLLHQAEAARSRAEQTAASYVQTFTPELDSKLSQSRAFNDGVARLQLLWDLRRAIDDDLLFLVYQPQFTMRSGSVHGAEALLRWAHPTLGVLEPREFLPLVREHGLMDAVTDAVLSRAIADASGWSEAGTAIRVAINLWAPNLDDDSLPDRIMSALQTHGLSAGLLTMEITEELMVADFARGRAVLDRLRDAGIRVAIDDFGSGYSTLNYLRELPVDEIKLDRQLIAPILYDQRAATIARSVIDLADEFSISSVAEGVEDEQTAQWLRDVGCDVGQGNYFCRPVETGKIALIASLPVSDPQ